MTGAYRRAIELRAWPGRAEAEMEDDFHHFAVTVRHDGARVTGADGRGIRYPWSRCPLAGGALAELEGLPITADPAAVYRHLDPRLQCTHMLEIAGLAVTLAARGETRRRYEAIVTDAVEGRSEVRLLADRAPAVDWILQDGVVTTPGAHLGLAPARLRSSDVAGLTDQEAERLLIVRRCVGLAQARGLDVDRFPTAAAMERGAACFVFRPGVAELAARRYGSVRDFSTGPGPLSGDHA